METSEVLSKAADLIEERGWHQLSYGDAKVGYCAIGAIDATVPETQVANFRAALVALTVHIDSQIHAWNDAPSRTAAEVVEALRACAVIEAAKETDVRVVEPRVAVSA